MVKRRKKKVDKNKNGRIDAEDFKILQGSKKGMRMGGMMYAQEGGMNSDRMTARDVEAAKARLETSATRNKYRTAQLEKALRSSPKNPDRLTRKDIEKASSAVGKRKGGMLKAKKGSMIKARSGTSVTSKVPIDHPDVIRRYNRFPKDKDKTQKYAQYLETHFRDKKAKKMTASEGSFKKGSMIKAKSGTLSESMKKLRKRAYEKSMKKNKKVGRFGDDEYMIQKPLPGMKKGKMIKAKTGKYVFDMIGVKPMSGVNKNKKKDGFLDDVFEKTIKKYGLKDPTKKK